MLVTRARDNASYLAFCNIVGGQDELVFDGTPWSSTTKASCIARAPGFEEALLVVDLDPAGRSAGGCTTCAVVSSSAHGPARRTATVIELARAAQRRRAPAAPAVVEPFEPGLEQMRLALGLGMRDYVARPASDQIVLGLSGGIDSALAAAIAPTRSGPRACGGHDAVALLVQGSGRRAELSRTSASTSARCRSRRSSARSRDALAPPSPAASPTDRGEPAGAHPGRRC